MKRRLVLFVEGDGDAAAVLLLVKKILSEFGLWEFIILDESPFKVGEVGSISGKRQVKWTNHLRAAIKRDNVGAILAVLDGDSKHWEGGEFCPMVAARELTARARETGAGRTYSLGFVFACLEYESWLLAGVESLAGKKLRDGREGVRAGTARYGDDLELAPRGAKETLDSLMTNGYKPTLDQAELTKLVDLNVIRQRGLRSFRRLESAIKQLAEACRSGIHTASPTSD